MTDTSNAQDYTAWIGHSVVDAAGDKVGKVAQIYADDETGQPEWLAINTGMFKSKASFVPLQGASADGDTLVIPFDKAKVKDAPRVEEDADGFLTPEEEQELYRYYGRSYSTEAPTSSGQDRSAAVGHDTSGPTTDDAMTRSEEQVTVGTRSQESGRVRLRKYVVTEMVTQTVPVSHEEVRVEREAITDANRPAATDGPEISEEEHEVVLHEERPVVQKQVVPVERVRLAKETVTGEETVSEEVRKERIEQDGGETGDQR
jgi:uncharacterized protein (TIGR02271 family)